MAKTELFDDRSADLKVESREGQLISDIVKVYPDMIKVVIYHNSYKLPSSRSVPKHVAKETKRQDSIHRSLRRTKATIKDIMLSNKFDLWCTFTYNCRSCYPKCTNNPCTCLPSACKRFDINYTRRVLTNWFRNQKKHSPNLRYLAVPEFHKNGAIHFHCLLSGFNGRLKDSGKRTKNGQTIYNASGYYSGYTEFVKIGDLTADESKADQYNRVASYLTKYVTKDMPLIHGRRRFLVSRELERPVHIVNGVGRLSLRSLVRGYKPDYIDGLLEVQTHPYTGFLTRGVQGRLFAPAPVFHVDKQDNDDYHQKHRYEQLTH